MAWSGLGMGQVFDSDVASMARQCNYLLSHGIRDIRVSLPDPNAVDVTLFYEPIKRAISEGMRVVWGVTSANTTLTASNYSAFRTLVLSAATWSQANGVYEFQIGNEEETHCDNTTLTVAALRDNLKLLATDVKAIFTRGNISYSPSSHVNTAEWISAWNTLGKGDIDRMGLNVYRDTGTTFDNAWKTNIDNLVANWGTDCLITEWNVSWRSTNSWSTDEEKQASGIGEMLEYIKTSGITRAYFFCWVSENFGIWDGASTYKLPWNNLSTNNGRKWFINV